MRNLKEHIKTSKTDHRAAGVPSIKNRWDADWIKLTKNDRPNSVPTRISRFTQKSRGRFYDHTSRRVCLLCAAVKRLH